ncbi:MAG: ATP-dependent RNA helicase HrpA [Granulosicoccaceae bacterium]
MASTGELHSLVDACLQADKPRLRRQIKKLGSDTSALARLCAAIEKSTASRELRATTAPVPTYPDDLPVVEQREAFLELLANNPVLIVCGETGSGKTTQIPKMCIEAGRGAAGFIGHTQPRRIAARTVAARIASELNTELAAAVGYKIRFSDKIGSDTRIKLMTDGMLLSETQNDPGLNQYDTIIIDEAHERSLNIDFLLGYIKRLLPKRPDLKVIITSATIDPQRFSKHFDDAPILLAEGRTYPVELRYQAITDDGEEAGDVSDAIVEACETLLKERHQDVLVFLSGERDIREMADLLNKQSSQSAVFRHVDVLPLFSRLSNADQNRIFASHSRPRIVLATNVAETSLTVPGIRSVVDAGYARISRYSVRSKVQRLPIEKISQASANQRMGRCGRVAPGVCIRLYDEPDFIARAEFTQPEILRTNLSSVILQMASMQLGEINDFPFVEKPDAKFINDGYRNLQELGALDNDRVLTPLGRQLARLPVDPRLGRMVLAARNEGCVNEMLTIVSALSVQDPRERPFDKRQAADEVHAEFNHEKSDFMAWLHLWSFIAVQRKRLSRSQFRKMCKQRFLSFMRVIEWLDVREQLQKQCRELKLVEQDTEAPYESIHRALLTGLLANVAVKSETHDYLGTRNRHLSVFPGSGLFKKGPKWLMAAEIAETSKLYARQVAAVEPEWIEALGAHLLQHSYRDPHWQKKRGTVAAWQQSTLYGLIINPKKRVNYSPINKPESRQVFIHDGLVEGGLISSAEFYQHNLELLEELNELEEKTRRRDIVVDPQELVHFYDSVIPEHVSTAVEFEQFRKQIEAEQPKRLFYSREMLLADGADEVSDHAFPDQMDMGNMVLPLRYTFMPGDTADGVTLVCPVEVINRIQPQRCEWLVPGMIEEKMTLLIKSLPKSLRRNFVPAPDYAKACADTLQADNNSLLQSLSAELQRMTGVQVEIKQWDPSTLPPHLLMRFDLVDNAGNTVQAGRDLPMLQKEFEGQVEQTLLSYSDDGIEKSAVQDWNFGDLPDSVDIERAGVTMQGYPALQFDEGQVNVKLFASADAALFSHPQGLRALYKLVLRGEVKYLQRKLPSIDVLSLRFTAIAPKKVLIDDIIDAAVDNTFITMPLPRTYEAFNGCLEANRAQLVGSAGDICEILLAVFEQYRRVQRRMDGSLSLSWIEAIKDIKDQISQLLYPGFACDTGLGQMARLPVYFQAMGKRLDAIDQAPDKDRARRAEFLPVWERFQALAKHQDNDYLAAHKALRWSFEELRVSLFAQGLKTAEKVSVARLEQRVKQLSDWH